MTLHPLKPGQSRLIESKPCPPNRYVYPNEYWLLRRTAKKLLIHNAAAVWNDLNVLRDVADAVTILRNCANQIPSKPCRSWEHYGLGEVIEICCPACKETFTVQGRFYAPQQCPNCKRFLNEQR